MIALGRIVAGEQHHVVQADRGEPKQLRLQGDLVPVRGRSSG